MNDQELPDRLRSFGTHPVPEEARQSHLRRIESISTVETSPGGRRFGPLAVAAACAIGFFAGSTGLAMAGALPDQAQSVAHDVLGVVQVNVPEGKDGKRGPCVSEAAKIEDEVAKQAAKDACPKGGDDDTPEGDDSDSDDPGKSDEAPGQSGDAPGQNKTKPSNANTGNAKHDDDPCKGRPAWAGPMTKEEREAAKAANARTDCPDNDDAETDEAESDEAESDATEGDDG